MPEVRISRFGLYYGERNTAPLACIKDSFTFRVMALFRWCIKKKREIDSSSLPVLPVQVFDEIVRASYLCRIEIDTRRGLVSSQEILVERAVPEWLLSWNKSEFFPR